MSALLSERGSYIEYQLHADCERDRQRTIRAEACVQHNIENGHLRSNEAGFTPEFSRRAPTTAAVINMNRLSASASPSAAHVITDPHKSPMFYKKPVALI